MANTDSKAIKINIFKNIGYFLKLHFEYSKLSLLLLILAVPFSLLLSYTSIYLPKLIVERLTNKNEFEQVILSIISVILLMFAIKLIMYFISLVNSVLMTKYSDSIRELKVEKCLKTTYKNIESSEFRLLMNRADQALWGSNNGTAVENVSKSFISLITNILEYIMFGTILTFANPYILILLTVIPIINYFLNRYLQKYQYEIKDETAKLDKKMWYIAHNSESFASAKDIRIYTMKDWILNFYRTLTKQRLSWDDKTARKRIMAEIVNGIIIFIRDGLSFFILIYMVSKSQISVDDFVFYFFAVSSFTNSLGGIIGKISYINEVNLLTRDLYLFLSYPEDRGNEFFDKNDKVEIELKNVGFSYSEDGEKILDDINLKINSNEKIALVGLNGAGKTTLIKIICGLYHPTVGKLCVNEKSSNVINPNEYYSLFSVVFQDHNVLPISIAEIVSAKKLSDTDESKVLNCLEKVGLYDKIMKLENKIHTTIGKQLNENGTELSGGELQKLLIARALYKDAPILILDEPTAALDPISEKEFYLKCKELFKNKIVIFISHRLSTTAFCDRIVYLKKGKISEIGTHKELLNAKQEYFKLFESQSKYYS